MLKNKDLRNFILILIISFTLGIFIFKKSYSYYSDLITFLSIMIGFKITSFSIIFNSQLKKTLYDRPIPKYETELHRLRNFYKHSFYFDISSILLLFILPIDIIEIDFLKFNLLIGKHLLILPIIIGSIFSFILLAEDLFKIFVYPTNE